MVLITVMGHVIIFSIMPILHPTSSIGTEVVDENVTNGRDTEALLDDL